VRYRDQNGKVVHAYDHDYKACPLLTLTSSRSVESVESTKAMITCFFCIARKPRG